MPIELDTPEAFKIYDFYHCIALPDGSVTPGMEILKPWQAPVLDLIKSMDLSGKRVLDIGCRDGLYSLTCEAQGAESILGIDNDLSRAAVEFIFPP